MEWIRAQRSMLHAAKQAPSKRCMLQSRHPPSSAYVLLAHASLHVTTTASAPLRGCNESCARSSADSIDRTDIPARGNVCHSPLHVYRLAHMYGRRKLLSGLQHVQGLRAMRSSGMRWQRTATDKFFLQYYFPPSSVGETGRVGAPGRREIGHGQLAQRALMPIIPQEVSPCTACLSCFRQLSRL